MLYLPSSLGSWQQWRLFPASYSWKRYVHKQIDTWVHFPFTLTVCKTLKRGKSAGAASERPMSTWSLVKSPDVLVVLYLYGLVMLIGLAYTAGIIPCIHLTHGLVLTTTISFTRILVYQTQVWWLRIQSPANINLSCWDWHITNSLASRSLSLPPTTI